MRPVLLVILDGWGSSARREGNAILLQGTPNLDRLAERFPVSQLQTSGLAVGLPEGQMGNSEVGHTNIGAGRVVYQDLVRINRAIDSGELFHDEVLRRAMHAGHGGAVHVFGLVSDGGVHSQDTHLAALVEMARREGVKRLFVHAFTDGRDTSPGAGVRYLDELEKLLAQKSSADGLHAQVATVSGRYYAMDRDKRWDKKWPRVSEVRRARPRLSAYTTMTEYDGKFTERGIPVAFPPDQPTDILPELVARAGARQLRCAETEKYAHVTFFFNGGRETVFPGEER